MYYSAKTVYRADLAIVVECVLANWPNVVYGRCSLLTFTDRALERRVAVSMC
jgi:hypothetical protein